MNYNLENRISMYYKVQEFFSHHLATIAATALALTGHVGIFNALLEQLGELMMIADENNKGVTTQKQVNRNNMQQLALSISGALFANAKNTANEMLAAKATTNISTLNQKRDTDVLYWCERLLTLVTPVAASLVPFGISAAMITDFENNIATYKASMQDPADKRSEGKAAYIEAYKKSDEIDQHLIITDAMMIAIEPSHSLLYQQYKADRLIDDNTGGISTPDVTEVIETGNTENIYTISYLNSRSFKIKNLSTETLEWGLSDDAINPTHPLISLSPNSVSTYQSSSLAPSGDFLLVKNEGAANATVELTIIE